MTASTKVIDTECPGCHKKHGVAVDLSELDLSVGKFDNGMKYDNTNTTYTLSDIEAVTRKAIKEEHAALEKEAKDLEEKRKAEEKSKALEEKPKKEIILPAYVPKGICKGKDCEGHKNENYSIRVKKKCQNCSQFAPENAKKCAFCGESDFENMDDDDLDALNIPKPEHEQHE